MVEEVETWVADPLLGGLYVRHADGKPCADTALVDRAGSRGEQLEELARTASWVPPQQLTAVYQSIVEAKQRSSFGELPNERRISPLLGGFAATIDADDGPQTHPVRRYLFPDVARSGELLLEQDETQLAKWSAFVPSITAVKRGGEVVNAGTPVPGRDLRSYAAVLTNQRLVFIGRLRNQTNRSNPSIFLPEALFDAIMIAGGIKQWVQRTNLYWGFHVRHEWLTKIGWGNHPEAKRPLLLRRDDTIFVLAGMTYPSGDTAVFRIPYKQATPEVSAIVRTYAEAVRAAQPGARFSGVQQKERSVPTGNLIGAARSVEATTEEDIEGQHPWSLPSRFEGGVSRKAG
jgi:hypothetical protein